MDEKCGGGQTITPEEYRKRVKFSDDFFFGRLMQDKDLCSELASNMLSGKNDPAGDAKKIIDKIGSHKNTYSHSRHIHIEECKNLGLCVTPLEELDKKEIDGCEGLHDCVLTIHHTYMHTFSNSTAVKIVENHAGNAMVIHLPQRS